MFFLHECYLGSAIYDLLAQPQQGLCRQPVGVDGELLLVLHVDEASCGGIIFRHSKVVHHVQQGGVDVDRDEEDLRVRHGNKGDKGWPMLTSSHLPRVLTWDRYLALELLGDRATAFHQGHLTLHRGVEEQQAV